MTRSILAGRCAALITTVLLLALPVGAQCTDAFEPNDDCSQAVPIQPGWLGLLTIAGAVTPGGTNPDFYRVVVPAGETLEVRVFSLYTIATLIRIYDQPGCTQPVATGTIYGDTARVTNTSGTPADYWIEVTQHPNGTAFGCREYELTVFVFLDICAALVPDAFEPNDTISSASVLPPGLHTDLNLHAGEPDYYRVPALPGDEVEVTLSSHLNTYPGREPDLYIVDAVTGNTISGPWPAGTVSHVNLTPHSEVGLRLSVTGDETCSEYDLGVAVSTGTCSGLAPDWLEDNDTCLERVTIPPRFYPDLNMVYTDRDYYRAVLRPEEAMVILVEYDAEPASGVAMQVFRGCDLNAYEYWYTAPGRVTCVVRNEGAENQGYTLALRVDGSQFDPLAPCAEYDLTYSRYDATTGTSYCDAVPNSSGEGAVLSVYGSTLVDDGELALLATKLPAHTPGLFFFGPNQAQVPFGDGLRCVGGALRRLGPPRHSGLKRHVFRVLDFDASPEQQLLTPGSTWHFQGWFRDGASSNFTNAVTVDLH